MLYLYKLLKPQSCRETGVPTPTDPKPVLECLFHPSVIIITIQSVLQHLKSKIQKVRTSLTLSKSCSGFSKFMFRRFPRTGRVGGPGGKFLGLRALSWRMMNQTQSHRSITETNMFVGIWLNEALVWVRCMIGRQLVPPPFCCELCKKGVSPLNAAGRKKSGNKLCRLEVKVGRETRSLFFWGN